MSDLAWGNIGQIPTQQMNWVAPREPNQDLDRQAFLNLLITQLRYQDPLNPMDDRDFIAQMAQFSALEQMMNLNATFERTQAFGMIGKLVDASFICATTEEHIEIEQGLVTSVRRGRGQSVYLVVSGENGRQIDVPFDAVSEVTEDFFLSLQLNELHNQVQGQRASDLIGKYVMGIARFGDDREFVEGRVDSVSMQDGMAVLVVGNRQIFFPHDVISAAAPSVGRRLIGSDGFSNSAGDRITVTDVDIVTRGNLHHVYLEFDNDPRTRTRINLINHITDALTYVDHRITFANANNGLVQSITIIGGIPFLNVSNDHLPDDHDNRNVRVDFLAYLAHRHGAANNPGGDDGG